LINEASYYLWFDRTTEGGLMMPAQSHTYDDLKAIKGIAATREAWLHEIGVRTIEDLAAAQAAKIEDELQAAGHATPLVVIEDWIDKAKTHLGTAPTAETTKSVSPETKDTIRSEWKTFAEFFVDYQQRETADGDQEQRTRVHRMRNGGKDKLWEGLAGESVGRWMLEQLGEGDTSLVGNMERPLPTTPPSPRKKTAPKAFISIHSAQLYQSPNENPIQLNESRRIFVQPVQHDMPFDLHAIFDLTGEREGNNGHYQWDFVIQAHATNKTTQKTFSLGKSEPQAIIPGQSQQMIILQGIRLPQGLYRLQLMVQALDQVGVLSFLEVPFLQVV
jgi:predicted flap endonuclease-1-like 5' DNA nuclease